MTALTKLFSPSIASLLLLIGLTFSQPSSISQEPYNSLESSLEADSELNEGIAYLWLLGATAVPMVVGSYLISEEHLNMPVLGGYVFAGGLFVGPSAGQFYAGANGRGTGGIGLRVLGAALTLAGIASLLSDWGCNDCENSSRNESQGQVLMILGAITYGGGNLYSLIDTHYAVKKHNEKISGRRSGILPILKLSPEGQLAGGGRVWLSF